MKLQELTDADAEVSNSNLTDPAKNLIKKLIERARTPLETDKWIYRSVVWALGLAVLACLFLTFFITVKDAESSATIAMPDIFLAVGSAAVGALAGLLAPSPGRRSD